jgi:hypothetical protein
MVFSFARVIDRRAERLRDMLGAMRKALFVLGLMACGGHAGAPAAPGAPAAASAFPAARWVPANPTYVVAARTVRDGQRALHDALDDLGMVAGFEPAEAGRELQQVLGVDPLSESALANIGVDLGGGMAVFSEDVTPTFVVHLAAPEAFAGFIDSWRGKGMVTVSKVVDGVELQSARIGGGVNIAWGVDKDWLWVHFAPPGAGTEWFEHSRKAASAAWGSAWAWAQKMAGKANVVGFARAKELLAAVVGRAANAKACVDQLAAIEKVGLSFDVDGKKVGAKVAFDLGPSAQQMASHVLAPPPGWQGAAQGAPASAQWNLDLATVGAWIAPCAQALTGEGDPLQAFGVRAARAFVLTLDPGDRSGTGAVSLDLANASYFAPYVDKAKHFSSDRTFGAYRGHHVSIPFVGKFDYVFDEHTAIGAMGDGVMDRIAAGTPAATPPVFALSLAPGGMPKDTWAWLFDQIGAPAPERLVERLSSWQEAHVTATLDGTQLVVEVAGTHR